MTGGSGYKNWNVGDTLTAADFDNYLGYQTCFVFSSSTGRDSAIASPTEGMVCYLTDRDGFLVYDGASWLNSGPHMPDVSAAQNWPSNQAGNMSFATSNTQAAITTSITATATSQYKVSGTV